MKWGLVPSFSHGKGGTAPDKFEYYRMFNARSETVGAKGIFKRLVGKKRCVVLVDAFYEWKKDASGQKQPFSVQRKDGKPLLLAALYDVYRGPLPDKEKEETARLDSGGGSVEDEAATASAGCASATATDTSASQHQYHDTDDTHISAVGGSSGDESDAAAESGSGGHANGLSVGTASASHGDEHAGTDTHSDLTEAFLSATILTTDPVPELAWLHDRMPLILSEADAERWLDCEHNDFEALAHPVDGDHSILVSLWSAESCPR
jgi:putative SOS response-associated peptidase YedK